MKIKNFGGFMLRASGNQGTNYVDLSDIEVEVSSGQTLTTAQKSKLKSRLQATMKNAGIELDANSAHNANLPFVLVKDGYTEKSEKEIKHDELISDFIGFEKIIEKYL